ncbi:MAG TPA: prepilin-type N-terminal cleavage/methylation domain-containing protein [Acidimicrobiales bacterium]|nr:prepilin-type N-terminal cleavage/methylation domain-containing protein [Acidimicrobiales bacterium]
MIEALRRRIDRDEEGFTLIELMVVVLIIAILIAIAIPTFLGAQDRARDRGAQSNLRNALTAAKTIATDAEGIFSGVTTTSMEDSEPVLNYQTAALTGTSVPKDIQVNVSAGTIPDPTTDTTGSGRLFLGVRSASGKFFGVCADYKGNVLYATGASTVRAIGNCTADKF